MWRAAYSITDCRTYKLGGHYLSCPSGHQCEQQFNSCRHRNCPQCALLAREQWLAGWAERLLKVPHYHVVFTTPHQLNVLWQYNRKLFADALFAAATGALKKLLADPKYLGATPGMLAALHTWSQTLAAHVHLHVLVTAGGLDSSGKWKNSLRQCLLPRKVLMIIFRGKLRSELLAALDRGKLELPPDHSTAQVRSLLNMLGRKVWNVKILDRYDHGAGVLNYLARYLKGGPIAPSRFISLTPHSLRFRCRPGSQEAGGGEVRLPIDEFFTRLLNHVPPKSMKTVRGYGLYAGGQREQLNIARVAVGQTALPKHPAPAIAWQEICVALGREDASVCRHCGAKLVVEGYFRCARPPPKPVFCKVEVGNR